MYLNSLQCHLSFGSQDATKKFFNRTITSIHCIMGCENFSLYKLTDNTNYPFEAQIHRYRRQDTWSGT